MARSIPIDLQARLIGLKSGDMDIRYAATIRLGKEFMNYPNHIGVIVAALIDNLHTPYNEETIFSETMESLRKIGKPAVQPLITEVKIGSHFYHSIKTLEGITGNNFGMDIHKKDECHNKWQEWWDKNKQK
jgi:hypothetical protein